MPVVEIAWGPASDAYLADRSLLKPALDDVAKADGCISAYSGVVEEDKKTVYLAIVWETYEHHKALMDHADYPKLGEKLQPALAGGLKMNHIEVTNDASVALGAPSTEVLQATLKEGKTKEAFVKIMQRMGELIAAGKGSFQPVAAAEAREQTGKFLALVGWESTQAHIDLVTTDKFTEPLQEMHSLADLQMVHVNFVKHA
ncbi:hypothetical protein B0H34DRAFT_707473 [Crassisporium funariophilum]|nr:hypothetical protein B0H34DRAFT_707473 [Crassisporium funariophilum]